MIKLEVINDDEQHFMIAANEPVRIEVSVVDGAVIAHIYPGFEVDTEQRPVGMYDGTLIEPNAGGNEDWAVNER